MPFYFPSNLWTEHGWALSFTGVSNASGEAGSPGVGGQRPDKKIWEEAALVVP